MVKVPLLLFFYVYPSYDISVINIPDSGLVFLLKR